MNNSPAVEAEMALVGAALFDNALTERVSLEAAHFYDPVLGDLWAEICARVRAGRGVDAMSLRDWMRQRAPELGNRFLLDLCETHLLTTHEQEYAALVRDAHGRREALAALRQALATLERGADLIETLGGLERDLRDMGRDVDASGVDLAASGLGFLDHLNAPMLSTGLDVLDKRLGGLQRGDLIILAGRPSMGKTSLAAQIGRNVAAQNRVVHFASLEMSREQLGRRAISAASFRRKTGFERIEYYLLRHGTNADRAHLAALAGELPRTFMVDDRGAQSLAQLEAGARTTRKRWKRLDLIVVDYLQLMRSTRQGSRVHEIEEISQGLKAIAKRLSVPLVALSQLSRGVEGRDNKRPTLSDLRDSGAIEQDADVVLGCYREAYYLERAEPPVTNAGEYAAWRAKLDNARRDLEVLTLKQRQGPIGADMVQAHLAFDTIIDRGAA